MRQYNWNRYAIEVDLIWDDVDTCSLNEWGLYTLNNAFLVPDLFGLS